MPSSHAIPYGRQNVTEEDIRAVVETLKSDYLTQGPKIQEFEEAFAVMCSGNSGKVIMNWVDE